MKSRPALTPSISRSQYHHGQDQHHCFYKHLMNQDFKFNVCLKPIREILKKEVHESLLKSKTNLGNQTKAPNPFPCIDKDTSQDFTSTTKSEKLEIASNLVNRDVREIETAQINLSDNFNTSQNVLPPIQNLNL